MGYNSAALDDEALQPPRFRQKFCARNVRPDHFIGRSQDLLISTPGISQQGRTPDQNAVLAAAFTYLKETISADMDVICSP